MAEERATKALFLTRNAITIFWIHWETLSLKLNTEFKRPESRSLFSYHTTFYDIACQDEKLVSGPLYDLKRHFVYFKCVGIF